MTSNTACPQFHYYNVCLPDDSVALCCPFNLPEGAKVQDLKEAIRSSEGWSHKLKNEEFFLYKVKSRLLHTRLNSLAELKSLCFIQCCDLEMDTAENPFDDVLAWLRVHRVDRRMQPTTPLDEYFQTRPTSMMVKKIDIIVATASILEALHTPNTETAVKLGSTLRKEESTMQDLVENFLRRYDIKLRQFLAGPPHNDFWEDPSKNAHPETTFFINNLKIPEKYGSPVLLLHDLGNGIVDQSVVDKLFTKESRFLVDASGSGKTRVLFEGFIKHWGFFLTFAADSSNYRLGSMDMTDAIERGITGSRSFTFRPEYLKGERQDHAYRVNHSIVKRHMHQILTARVLVFEFFLKMAQATFPTRPINEFKKHWLFLQLNSLRIFRGDLFSILSDILKAADDGYLMMGDLETHDRLVAVQTKYGLDKDFFLGVDDSQTAMRMLDGSFRSEVDKSIKWPVLRPIVSTLVNASMFPVIVSGAGLSNELVNDIEDRGAAIREPQRFTYAKVTGAFDDCERQRKYIMRYMPRHIAESESGNEFLRRAWTFARGRHRFTASLVVELLRSSFQSPHRVLNAYVETFCGFLPSDGQRFVEEEEIEKRPNFSTFYFKSIRDDPNRRDFFCGLLRTWLMDRKVVPLTDKDKDLVQQGFARFVGTSGETVIVDEPLVLLAATHEFRDIIRFSSAVEVDILRGLGFQVYERRDEY